jgi:eukaryotic-like serine/threonine-protein kinase
VPWRAFTLTLPRLPFSIVPRSAEPTDLDIGDLRKTYAVIREIGRGGMGAVLLARHRTASHLVAIKIASAGAFGDSERLARFARESRLMARFRHPNIVQLYDIRQIGRGRVGIVMEYVDGLSLAALVREHRSLPYDLCTDVLRDVAKALGHAHAHGVVHRDVKPQNVLVESESGRAKLFDFGIAKGVGEDADVTATGAAVGTPAYMSPEQIDGRSIDARSDVYSLGLLGWEMISGERPWAGLPLFQILYKQKHESLPSLTLLRPDIPNSLLLAVEGALEKDPALRWPGVSDFVAQLDSETPTAAMIQRRQRAAATLQRDTTAQPSDRATMPLRLHSGRSGEVVSGGSGVESSGSGGWGAPVPGDGRAMAPVASMAAARPWFVPALLAGGVLLGAAMTYGAIALRPHPTPVQLAAAPLATAAFDTMSAGTRPPPPIERVVTEAPARASAAQVSPTHDLPSLTLPPTDRPVEAPIAAAGRPLPRPLITIGEIRAPADAASDRPLEVRARSLGLAVRGRSLAIAGRAAAAQRAVDSALALDPRNGVAYLVQARLRIARNLDRDAWTDVELAERMGAHWEALAIRTLLQARQEGARAARGHLAKELRQVLVPDRTLDGEQAVGMAKALAVVGDTATALAVLERAGTPDLAMLPQLDDPLFARVSGSRRFVRVRRMFSGASPD